MFDHSFPCCSIHPNALEKMFLSKINLVLTQLGKLCGLKRSYLNHCLSNVVTVVIYLLRYNLQHSEPCDF